MPFPIEERPARDHTRHSIESLSSGESLFVRDLGSHGTAAAVAQMKLTSTIWPEKYELITGPNGGIIGIKSIAPQYEHACDFCEEAEGTESIPCSTEYLLCVDCLPQHLQRFTCAFHGDDH